MPFSGSSRRTRSKFSRSTRKAMWWRPWTRLVMREGYALDIATFHSYLALRNIVFDLEVPADDDSHHEPHRPPVGSPVGRPPARLGGERRAAGARVRGDT